MKSVIISGGEAPSYELVKKELENSYYLICADSGANCLYKYGLYPDIILGDLDSIDKSALHHFEINKTDIIRFKREKDFTDTYAAVKKAVELGCNEIVLLGCTGSRIDHILGNIGILLECLKLKVCAVMKDEHNTISIINNSTNIQGKKGDIFSLIPYGENIEGLNIIGAKYPLENYLLEVGSGLGVSNEFLEEEVKITFTKGTLMVIFSKD